MVLDGLELVLDCGPSPEQYAEAADLLRAVRSALDEVLTAYQRRIVLCLLIEAVPVDVLAERLGTNRGALYKTLHDARQRLRAHLAAAGYEIHSTARAGGR